MFPETLGVLRYKFKQLHFYVLQTGLPGKVSSEERELWLKTPENTGHKHL